MIHSQEGLLIFQLFLTYNASQKHESTLLHTYVMNEFLTIQVKQSILEKTFIENGSSHLCTSFGTFCVQIGHLFEAQICLKINKSQSSKEKVGDFAILPNVQRLTVPRIIDQFGHKRCQKKRKEVDYQLL